MCTIIPKPMENGSLKTSAGGSGFRFQLADKGVGSSEKTLKKDSIFRCMSNPEDQVLGCLLLEE